MWFEQTWIYSTRECFDKNIINHGFVVLEKIFPLCFEVKLWSIIEVPLHHLRFWFYNLNKRKFTCFHVITYTANCATYVLHMVAYNACITYVKCTYHIRVLQTYVSRMWYNVRITYGWLHTFHITYVKHMFGIHVCVTYVKHTCNICYVQPYV